MEQVHALGAKAVQPAADAVDRDARFPVEAFAALKEAKLLSAYVPRELGGMGLDIAQVARICEALGQYCGSTAMIFAMHQIQVALHRHHAAQSAYFRDYLASSCASSACIASATTEIGVGGDCARASARSRSTGERFSAREEGAGDLLRRRRRRHPASLADAQPMRRPSDQVHVLAAEARTALEPLSGWDTLGFRGTCSSGFVLTRERRARADPAGAVRRDPRARRCIRSRTSSGPRSGSASRPTRSTARAPSCAPKRGETRRSRPRPRCGSPRSTSVLQSMRGTTPARASRNIDECWTTSDVEAFGSFGFSIRINNLKLACSDSWSSTSWPRDAHLRHRRLPQRLAAISLGRHLRDAYGAALMVNNDRIMNQNATMLLVQREG